MQFFHLSHKGYLFKLIFNIFTILFILAQDNSITIDICIISPNLIMWYQSSKPSTELLLCQWKLSLLCSLRTTVAHPWAKPSWGTCKEALRGTPHQCGLVIPATLYDHLGGWVPGGNASAPCSGMHPGIPRRPTCGRLTIHVAYFNTFFILQLWPFFFNVKEKLTLIPSFYLSNNACIVKWALDKDTLSSVTLCTIRILQLTVCGIRDFQ